MNIRKTRTVNTEVIISQLRAADDRTVDQSFAYIYREYFPVIHHYIRSNHGSEEDAADVFQDALIVLYDKVRDVQFQLTCSLKTYLFSICKNLWLKKLAKRKQHELKSPNLETVPLTDSVLAVLEENEQSLMISHLLKQVGEDGEKILTYYYFDGLKTAEITRKMGYASEFVTRNKKFKILKALRQLLEGSELLRDFLR